jgi:hypothetical protein
MPWIKSVIDPQHEQHKGVRHPGPSYNIENEIVAQMD